MKKLFYSLLFLIPLSISAQTETPKENVIIYNNIQAKPGELYVDNVKMDPAKVFLDHDNFRDVKVVKSEADKDNKKAKGATFITRKSKPKFYTLSDVIKDVKSKNDKIKDATSIKVVVDGKEIKKPEEYMIEKSVISGVNILVNDEKGVNREGTTPSILITTKNKKK